MGFFFFQAFKDSIPALLSKCGSTYLWVVTSSSWSKVEAGGFYDLCCERVHADGRDSPPASMWPQRAATLPRRNLQLVFSGNTPESGFLFCAVLEVGNLCDATKTTTTVASTPPHGAVGARLPRLEIMISEHMYNLGPVMTAPTLPLLASGAQAKTLHWTQLLSGTRPPVH